MQLRLFLVPVKDVISAEAEMNAFLRGRRRSAGVKVEFDSARGKGEPKQYYLDTEHRRIKLGPTGRG
jgi:hypothetical protein